MKILVRTLLILILLPVLLVGAPPDVPEIPDKGEKGEIPDIEAPPDAEPKPEKYIEIQIDDDGIRAVDLQGNEVLIESGFSDQTIRGIGDCEESVTKIGTYYINEDEELNANLVVFGDVIVEGAVYCDIVSSKTVTLGPMALVTGDIMAKKLNMDPNAEFLGDFTEYEISWPGPDPSIGLPNLPAWISMTIFALLAAMLVQLVFPKAVTRVSNHIDENFFKDFFVGFLIMICIPLAIVILCITIVGIPIVVLVFPFAFIAAVVLAKVGVAKYTGILLGRRFSSLKYGNPYLTTAIGIVLMMFSWLISGFFASVGSKGMAIAFLVIGIVVVSIMTLTGLGALWFSRFGTRPKEIEESTEEEIGPDTATSVQTN